MAGKGGREEAGGGERGRLGNTRRSVERVSEQVRVPLSAHLPPSLPPRQLRSDALSDDDDGVTVPTREGDDDVGEEKRRSQVRKERRKKEGREAERRKEGPTCACCAADASSTPTLLLLTPKQQHAPTEERECGDGRTRRSHASTTTFGRSVVRCLCLQSAPSV